MPGLDELEQRHGQLGGRQAPQRHGGLVGPDRDPARPGAVQQGAGAGGFGAGVGAAFAVQHDQQRPGRPVRVVGGQGGGVPARPGAHHQVRLPAPRRADDDLMAAHRGIGHGGHRPPAVADRADGGAHHDLPPPVSEREGAGGGDPATRGARGAAPLPGVEHHRGGGGLAGQAVLDRVDPPRPQPGRSEQPGRDRDRSAQHERGHHPPGGGQVPGMPPVADGRQRQRLPGADL